VPIWDASLAPDKQDLAPVSGLGSKNRRQVFVEARGNRRYERGGKPPSEYCYLSDANVLSLPSLIGDDFLKFDKE
jgi:hypothetical protein